MECFRKSEFCCKCAVDYFVPIGVVFFFFIKSDRRDLFSLQKFCEIEKTYHCAEKKILSNECVRVCHVSNLKTYDEQKLVN